MIVDAQVHAYAADGDAFPWAGHGLWPELPEMTGAQTVAAMDSVGVDAAILVSTWVTYRWDTRYAEATYLAHPDRFRIVAPIDPRSEQVAERVAAWAETPGAVGVRLLAMPNRAFDTGAPGVADVARGAAAGGLVVNVQCWGQLTVVDELAAAHPETQFVLDHAGMLQPVEPPVPDDVFADLDSVLGLARHPNLAVKLTGVCTYSRQPYPYEDLWEPIGRMIDAFGVERCMWGTDWQRATRIVSYEQAVSAFRDAWPMSDADRRAIMGENAMRIYSRW